MPTLAQMGGSPNFSPSLLPLSPLWNRELKSIQPLELSLFLWLHKGTPDYFKAVREVEALKARVWADDPPLLGHTIPQETFTSGDLVEWLGETSLARRRALLFALEMDLEPREIIDLTWKDLSRLELTELAAEIVAALPRHIRLPYLFWDTLPNGAAAPLFGLHETALEVSQGMGMTILRKLYSQMVMLDAQADGDSAFVALSVAQR